MKSPKRPEATPAESSAIPRPPGPPPDPHEGYVYHSTSALLHSWSLRTPVEAQRMLQDSLRHAHSLTWIMVERYARGDHAPLNDTLDLLFDLLDVAFRTVEWWEPEEEGQP